MSTASSKNAAPTVGVPTAPPLPADLEALLRRLWLPHVRRHAPDVVATAKAQRWEPAEVLKALFAEEIAGRERSALATRRAAAGFEDPRYLDAAASSIPATLAVANVCTGGLQFTRDIPNTGATRCAADFAAPDIRLVCCVTLPR